MDKADVNKIWEEVKINHNKLNSCEGPHDFQDEPLPEGFLIRKKICTKCNGTLDRVHAIWYDRGVEHGKISNL